MKLQKHLIKKKTYKKVIPFVMAGAMLAQTATPVLAAQTESQDVGYDEASAGTQKDAVVKTEKNSEFTVTIPKMIMLDSNDAADYTVNVKGSVLPDESVKVKPHDNLEDVDGINFTMQELAGKKADAIATAVQDDTLWASTEITAEGTEKTGNITAEGITAGTWEGNLTFDINMDGSGSGGTGGETGGETEKENINTLLGAVTISSSNADGNVVSPGDVLSVVTEKMEGTGDLTYKWFADGEEITDETGSSYTVKDSDIGKTISAEVRSSLSDGIAKAEFNTIVTEIDELSTMREPGLYVRSINNPNGEITYYTYDQVKKGYNQIGGISEFVGTNEVVALIIPDGETTMPTKIFSGQTTFKNASNLEKVVIPNTITIIPNDYFKYCEKLTSVKIPENCTLIGSNAFQNSGLTSITVPKSCNLGEGVFSGCSNLKTAVIESEITSLPKQTFDYCDNLTSVKLPDTITEIKDRAFERCFSLKNLNNTSQNEENTDKIVIPSTIKIIGYLAFSDIPTTIEIPDTVSRMDSFAFSHCYHINYYGSATGAPWEALSMNEEAAYTGNEPGVHISQTNGITTYPWDWESYVNSTSSTKQEHVYKVVVPEGTTTIKRGLFKNAAKLTEVIIPDSVTSIDSETFQNCTSLKKISLPDSIVELSDHLFDGCTSLEEITISDKITEISLSCFNKTPLKKINIIGRTTENTDENTLVIPNTITKIDGYAFMNGTTENIIIPNSVESIGTSAFYNCNHIVIRKFTCS